MLNPNEEPRSRSDELHLSDVPHNHRQPGAATAAVERVLVDDHRVLLAFLQRRLGTREDAKETMHSFILRAIERSPTLREVRSLRGWLSRLLATAIADNRRAAPTAAGRWPLEALTK